MKCKKQEVYGGIFHGTFFAFRIPFFICCISGQGRHSRKNSKDFVVYFFVALIKHEIRIKCKKCIASVSYFMVFREKHSQNAKCVQLALESENILQQVKKITALPTLPFFLYRLKMESFLYSIGSGQIRQKNCKMSRQKFDCGKCSRMMS